MSSNTGQSPLSEVSPMAQRRNSPSWNQTTKMMKTHDASPYEAPASPRLFWQGRESGSPFHRSAENQNLYDPEGSTYTPRKRPSLENLKRASRVKNNNMFRDHNTEYDPTQVYVPQRPLALNRQSQRQAPTAPPAHQPDVQDQSPAGPRPPSPSKDQVAPAKSSLSRASRFGSKDAAFDPENEIWSDIDGSRHAKSVTFDAAPPQVNEYEMTTPDPSSIASGSREGSYDSEDNEDDASFDRESSLDRDDSFDASLEDLEKTPVVLPEDWRYMSPETADGEILGDEEDHFTEDDKDHSPVPRPSSQQGPPVQHARVESMESNTDRRPLPPLPPSSRPQLSQRGSPGKMTAAFELGSGNQRVLPSPPAPASYSKSEITERNHGHMSLEERLHLMMIEKKEPMTEEIEIDGPETPKALPEEPEEPIAVKDVPADKEADTPAEDDTEVYSPPRISRDSILRDLRKSESFLDDSFEDASQAESSPNHYFDYDPDVPIPSMEHDHDESHDYDDDEDDETSSVIIKPEEHEDDLYDIPEYYETVNSEQSSSQGLKDRLGDDDESRYSSQPPEDISALEIDSQASEDRQDTPVAATQTEETPVDASIEATDDELTEEPIDMPADESMDVSQVDSVDEERSANKMAAMRESLQRPATPESQNQVSEPSTPDSVVRHPIGDEQNDQDVSSDESVPEPIATVKAPGTRLKTRPSLTPADLEQMAATRRKVSGHIPPPMPCLTKQDSNDSQGSATGDGVPSLPPPQENQRQSSLVKLDIPFSIQEEDSLGFDMDKEFDRVIESQKVAFELSLSQLRLQSHKHGPSPQFVNRRQWTNGEPPKQRGYLMRHNTKVIIASSSTEDDTVPTPGEDPGESRAARAAPTPRKPSQQTWTTVPWNGQTRRASMRTASGVVRKKTSSGPVPPLPGQQSSVQEQPSTMEEAEPALNGALEEGEERGRLFVKVVGMKYLDLPLPRGERSYFALTLDNGLHCVTTSWLELGKTAPIGQEFELIVQHDLEFQLTLQMKVDEEKFRVPEPTPTASPSRPKTSTFSRVFASPRKRKELEMKQQLASQQSKAKDINAPVWERLRTLVARDGSFARAYVSLSDHEKYAYGRPYTVDVACFNEWAVEEQPSSVKSKKSTTSTTSQRRPPYKIGKLELQLLFVPKPKGAKEDDMPKSMNACIREMREAESVSSRSWEGFLSQQGGDCPYWRRRFFKLQGSKLTAYHETTRQPRATINLSKAVKLIDDRSSLMQKETTTRGGGRRKSAFAEEEEGYMFVEEGFRIRFGNGEVIDFYADSAADKDGWMKVLADAVGKGSSGSSQAKLWTEMVLKRERSMKVKRESLAAASTSAPAVPATAPPAPPVERPRSQVAPPPPAKPTSSIPMPTAPAPNSASKPRHKHTQSQPEVRGADARRQKTRSLMF
ncbi:putative GTP binding protein (Bud4) [Aspergillus saccharolyticus JOP 1030-1]|uniref:GTP-binding protein n=1 Tax=Aspergillus saccharolyticus JOP 1030-1 TaxID=1450539 RepID=A0A318ZPK2_9EURO|nr:GTP-binding protein [Aspergillus saccharolyticus JOP 1030-1]PYH45850.1 GTP-binding protein [Aspergillus saccharolyticus JOP 1030-1]